MAVFSTVDRQRRSTQYRNILAIQFHCQVVRDLATYGYDHTLRHFQVHHIEYTFERKFVEVQTVAHIVVGRNRFRVVVDHDRLVTQFTCSLCCIYRTPVELYGRTDAVSTRSQDHYALVVLVVRDIMFATVVCHIQVVSQFRMFGSDRVDTFYARQDTHFLTQVTYTDIFFLHIAFRLFHIAGDLEVRET